ncbi:MAG: hypothetical protein H6590_08665 [Flavobacteriales bacterium]|nr:hypothetical protein [Flavobacteriales bacterium]
MDERIHADCASWQDVEWALLPDDLRMARKDIPRYVHAKVYRFFNARERREILYVGSANMTTAAHQRGNLECGFLVETEPDRRPTWWTEPLEREPQRFEARSGSGEAATSRGSLLAVRYHWARGLAEVFWMGSAASPRLVLSANGTHLADLDPLGPGSWQAAPAGLSERLRRLLPTTSLLQVSGEQEEELPILVMEEGMSHKPSLLRELTAEQILQYWATLSPEQRAAFIEEHALDAFFQGEEGWGHPGGAVPEGRHGQHALRPVRRGVPCLRRHAAGGP